MATIAPMAEWKPFTGKSKVPLTHDIVCVHTMVGTLLGSWSWANQDGKPYWHFGLAGNGRLLQCQELEYRSAANLEGNDRVIPIETADMKEGIFPDWTGSNVPAWTDAQVNKLVELIAWLCQRYNIPPVLIPDTKPGRRGLAYHRQGIDPWRVSGGERWSTATGKVCPGDRRISQFINIVIPRVQALVTGSTPGDWLDMATEAEVRAIVREENQRLAQYLAMGEGNQAFPTDVWGRGTTLNEVAVDPEKLAAAIVAKLPSGGVDGAVVKQAVKDALREGTA